LFIDKPVAVFPDARLARATAPVCAVLVDAEEDFDWRLPVRGVPHTVDCMRHLGDFDRIVADAGAVPTYLLTYPVLQDVGVVQDLRARVARGACRVGIHLHPWVTPPFHEVPQMRYSFAGNLPAALEERKLLALMRLFRIAFGHFPTIYRAGRYGLGPNTLGLLEKHGFDIDTSLAPCSSFAGEGGPDFSRNDYGTFWFGRSRRLLELPLCRSIAGWGGTLARFTYRWLAAAEPPRRTVLRQYLPALMARTRCAERITLSPEGGDASAAARLITDLARRQRNVVTLSLHSSSFQVGQNPYVRTRAELHQFYDRLGFMLDTLKNGCNMRFAAATELPGLLAEKAKPACRMAAE